MAFGAILFFMACVYLAVDAIFWGASGVRQQKKPWHRVMLIVACVGLIVMAVAWLLDR